ncbi:MAG: histidine phosphatase family protein [Chloroflexi bacterium]|nr:histidine phosphatase family protein [Chloroflexota bacterium]
MIHKDFQCEFYFIRHGESTSNATPGFAAGVDFDSPLTSKGLEQARLLGQRLKAEDVRFDRVYSSSLTRAVQTTETMLQAMGEADRDFPKVDAIIEQQLPGWRGVPTSEALTTEMVAYMRGKGGHFVPPQGESYRNVQRRFAGWLEDEILYNEDLVSKEKSLTVAVVGHGAATQCLLHYIMGFDESFIGKIRLDNTSVSRFRFDHEGWFSICINDSWHIRTAGISGSSEITP